MKYSLNWIKSFVDLKIQSQSELDTFLDKMAIDGFETEGIEKYDLDSNIVVARIHNIKKHPNADKLSVCEVCVNSESYKIVCGAKNLYPNMLVALAKIGTKLPGGLKIKKSKIRDEVSEGMLCSASELGLAEKSDGIMDLTYLKSRENQNSIEGSQFKSIIDFPDSVVDFNITPDRGNVLSHCAFAKEISILNNLNHFEFKSNSVEIKDTKTALNPKVENSAKKSCPKYLLRSITQVDNQKQTPAFIRSRLIKSGINCINPVVDILNYVMVELGQPMHAFDTKSISGNITVRFAQSNEEKIELINHNTVEIKKDTLLIVDEKKPVAIAGVMGTLNTAVNQQSSDILIECAYFDSKAIAGKSRLYNLSSDAAYRYERGVDFNLPEIAIERASELIIQYLGGNPSEIFSAICNDNLPKLKPICLDFEKTNQVLGLSLSNQEIEQILSRIAQTKTTEKNITLTPPSSRYDLRIGADLIEEIVRIYGYQKIKNNPLKVLSHKNNSNQFNQKRIRDFFVDRGYNEVISYSFISPDYHNLLHSSTKPIILDNPISVDKSVMRDSLLSGLIETYKQNKKYKTDMSQFFEMGACFKYADDNKFSQTEKIAGLLAGKRYARNWNHSQREVDFFDLKGDLESIFEFAGIKVNFEAISGYSSQKNSENVEVFHPNQSAVLKLHDQIIGYAGFINPEIIKTLEIDEGILVFEFNLESIIHKSAMQFKSFSRFPIVKRDLAFLVPENTTASEIYQSIHKLQIKDLIDIKIFDVYSDKSNNEKSIGIELNFQSDKETFTDEFIQKMLQNIIEQLTTDLPVKFRDF